MRLSNLHPVVLSWLTWATACATGEDVASPGPVPIPSQDDDDETETMQGQTTGPQPQPQPQPTDSCDPDTACVDAVAQLSVSGDQGPSQIEFEGDAPTFVAFRVTEDNNELAGEPLRFEATLRGDYDLAVYVSTPGNSDACGGRYVPADSEGATSTLSVSWGEGAIANGTNDGAKVVAGIVARDLCGGDWTLVVNGAI